MNTRGLTELIALNIGYDHGFLSQRAFTIFVIMAVVTTLMTGPLLGVLLPRGGYLVARRLEA
jgi:Kef-type K+ transport system membrane component KefB